MIRPTALIAGVLGLTLFASVAVAQQSAPGAPSPAAAPLFPAPDPANFTAAQPTKEVVNAFLNSMWGYEDARMWQVQAIQSTDVPNISKVTVYIADKTGAQKPAVLTFFSLPDGKHIITGDSLIPFGERPYAEARAILQQRADGPYRGAAAKDLMLVEFADYQCPHCKLAQPNMDKLAVDFPKARLVFQNFPLTAIHPAAKIAAQYGVCVTKLGGSTAFFSFSAAVFEGQEGLLTEDGATLTLNGAVTKAGLDPAKVAACAKLSETIKVVDASEKLADDLNIDETPMLLINGRPVPANAPYETIKKLVEFQAKLDGVTL